MDRLTWQPPNYYGYFTPKDGIDGMDCVQKLAEYEDTGLSPAEVAELAQAKAVKHGKWIVPDDTVIACICSVCGWESNLYEDDVMGMPYCPNCGAKMDSESESNGE